jgi:hypothetical protein
MKKKYDTSSPDPTDHPDADEEPCPECGEFCNGQCFKEGMDEMRQQDERNADND